MLLINHWHISNKGPSQWTHSHRFAIDSTSKFHMESSSKLHRFWKANQSRNYDMDSTWKFWRGFDFQNRRNIDEFSTWIFRRCFDVELTLFLYSLFSFYYFLTFSALGTYSKLFWYSAESMWFQQYWRNHWYWNYWIYILWEFLQQHN